MAEIKAAEDLVRRARQIKLLLMDCDGVLTDGRLYFSATGEQMKVFNVRDGQGLVSWHASGFLSGIITGRDAREIINARAAELGIRYVITGSQVKTDDLEAILENAQVSIDETAFIGDDIGDIELLKRVALPIVVADAVEEVKAVATYITKTDGGFGAVREVIDLLLGAKLRER